MGFGFNASKCVVLKVKIRKRHHAPDYDYKLGAHHLLNVDHQNDLGITVSNNLSWKSLINQMICKANRILGMIRYTCYDVDDSLTRKILYLTHVRPILEYGSEIWSPLTQGLIRNIEKVQRRATKFILKSSSPYEVRLNELNLLTLEDRRNLKVNILFFKGINNMTFITTDEKTHTRNSLCHNLRSSDNLTLIPNKCRTETFCQTFFNRISNSLNNLPPIIRNTQFSHNSKPACPITIVLITPFLPSRHRYIVIFWAPCL